VAPIEDDDTVGKDGGDDEQQEAERDSVQSGHRIRHLGSPSLRPVVVWSG
jgi:hypothetical protein